MGGNPYDGNLFLFFSRRRDRVKILHWDRGGFVLYYKRLEKGRFQFRGLEERPELDAMELSMLLSGIDVVKVRRPDLWKPGAKTEDRMKNYGKPEKGVVTGSRL